MKIKFPILISLLISFNSLAQEEPKYLDAGLVLKSFIQIDGDMLLKSFTQCDEEFFSVLNEPQYNYYFQLNTLNEKQSYIVTEIFSSGKYHEYRHQTLSKPIEFSGLKSTEYKDLRSIYRENERYFYWGFEFDNSEIQDIKQTLSWVDWHKESEQLYISNAVIYKNNQWITNPDAVSGIKPENNTAEKLLLLELDPKTKKTTLHCTIQGNIPQSELTKIRPDLL